jgi:hypothetical protein
MPFPPSPSASFSRGGASPSPHVSGGGFQAEAVVTATVAAAAAAREASNEDLDDDDEVVHPDEAPFAAVHADEDEADDEEDPFSDFEMVGLHGVTNGRSCNLHVCCGTHVVVGDVVRLKKTIVEVHDGIEESIACVLVRRGRESCIVGFIPRPLHHFRPILEHINKHAQVVEMYSTSRNTQKRRHSHMNVGVAGCCFIDTIPQDE